MLPAPLLDNDSDNTLGAVVDKLITISYAESAIMKYSTFLNTTFGVTGVRAD